MRTRVIGMAAAGLALLWLSGAPNEVVITFDDLDAPAGGARFLGNRSYASQGFEVSPEASSLMCWQRGGAGHDRSAALLNDASGLATTRLKEADGGPFSLKSIDVGPVFENSGPVSVTFRAYASLDDTVAAASKTITVGSDGWETVVFPASFSSVARVEWKQEPQFHQFDNIVVVGGTAAPGTRTVALFGSGLLGLAVYGRRRRRS